MIVIQKDEYVFEVDFEKTIDYYRSHSLCECEYCENFYAQINGKFPKLESFLSDFGVDISKPDEIMSLESDNTINYIQVDYTVCGKVATMGQYEIDLHDNLLLSLVITDGFASPNEQMADYFTISVYNIELPWVLEKPFPEPVRTKAVKKAKKGFFSISKPEKPNSIKTADCLTNIKRKIAEKSGIAKCIELNDHSAAFSGTADNYDLYVSLDIVKKRSQFYLHAYMEDRLEWNEWDYKSQDDFEDSIVAYICEKINRTIKTVTETKSHKYVRVTEYYLDKETNEWILLSDDTVSWLIMRPFIEDDSLTEEIKEYHL